MKKAIMKKWVAALRSGEFKQTRGRLEDGEGYCCLGVLCTIAMNEGVCDYEQSEYGEFLYDSDSHILPRSVQKWANLKNRVGLFINQNIRLVDLNDRKKRTFKEIADIIEENYKDL